MNNRSNFLKYSGILAVAILLITGVLTSTNVQAGPAAQATGTAGADASATAAAGGSAGTGDLAVTATAMATASAASGAGAADTPGQSAVAKCVPAEVAVYVESPRIHVKCQAPTQKILYFALATTDAALAQRVLTVLTTAMTARRALSITFEPSDLSGESIGCLAQDCRLIRSVSLLP